jgi:hypothetical protein
MDYDGEMGVPITVSDPLGRPAHLASQFKAREGQGVRRQTADKLGDRATAIVCWRRSPADRVPFDSPAMKVESRFPPTAR